MQPGQIIEQVESTGGELVFLHGKLQGRGFDQDTRDLVKNHKALLIEFLQRKPVEPVRPFITGGELRIPLGCSPEYLYWQGGKSIFDTLIELGAPGELIECYISPLGTPEAWARWEHIKESRKEL